MLKKDDYDKVSFSSVKMSKSLSLKKKTCNVDIAGFNKLYLKV